MSQDCSSTLNSLIDWKYVILVFSNPEVLKRVHHALSVEGSGCGKTTRYMFYALHSLQMATVILPLGFVLYGSTVSSYHEELWVIAKVDTTSCKSTSFDALSSQPPDIPTHSPIFEVSEDKLLIASNFTSCRHFR